MLLNLSNLEYLTLQNWYFLGAAKKEQIAPSFQRAPRISRIWLSSTKSKLTNGIQNVLYFRNVMYRVFHKRNYITASFVECLQISEQMSFRQELWLAPNWNQETQFRNPCTLTMLCSNIAASLAKRLIISE